ncbi:MAG TPA: MFS transporter [Verrucomicrobiae bacterium]|nr:MFS transporter [Verrucomicrobiae bacterium]
MSSNQNGSSAPWYAGVNSYQWLILIIASAGWIFDVYEGQIFNITAPHLLPAILAQTHDSHGQKFWTDVLFGVFLLGGATGGLIFGLLADKLGRKPTLIATILMYSLFSGLMFFARTLWQVGLLRFLVAMGTGGEWAVAASLVAEVFPSHARSRASGIFHASSVTGTWIATSAGLLVGIHWRYAYLMGIIPALLVAWVMRTVKESPRQEKQDAEKSGSLKELLFNPKWGRQAILGMLLAAVGLGTYWAVHVAGQSLAESLLVKQGVPHDIAIRKGQIAYGYIETFGGILGLLCFAPLCERFGRKRAFIGMQIAAFLITPVVCYLPRTYGQLLVLMPVFGFLTLSIHAGYAIYFPELFPTRLRATGAGFCFNVGRVAAAWTVFFSAWLKKQIDLRLSLTLLGGLFLVGAVIMLFLPETKGRPLPE